MTSVDRDPGGDGTLQGVVSVTQNEAMVAELKCDPGSASNSLDVVWDLKESIGQRWKFASQSWRYTCNNQAGGGSGASHASPIARMQAVPLA